MKSLTFLFLLLSSPIQAMTLMSYNVENLFDTLDDKNKEDEAYMPVKAKEKSACKKVTNPYYRKQCETTDWTEKKLAQKLSNIKEVVSSYPKEPDFLAVIEVENDRVLKMLGEKLGYSHFASTHSPDERGVDVALFYTPSKDVSFVSSEELEIKEGMNKPTRNILITHFKVKKNDLFIFVNHWPSQGAPTAVRLTVAKAFMAKVNELKKKFPKASMIATGDFNTLDREWPQPFAPLLENIFKDTRTLLEKDQYHGSYFYGRDMTWNLLDRFFVTEDIYKNKESKSEVWAPEFARGVYEYTYKDSIYYGSRIIGTPKRFDHKAKNLKKMGYSDHFPIVLNFYL